MESNGGGTSRDFASQRPSYCIKLNIPGFKEILNEVCLRTFVMLWAQHTNLFLPLQNSILISFYGMILPLVTIIIVYKP